MDVSKEGTANSPAFYVHTSRIKKNPLLTNKGCVGQSRQPLRRPCSVGRGAEINPPADARFGHDLTYKHSKIDRKYPSNPRLDEPSTFAACDESKTSVSELKTPEASLLPEEKRLPEEKKGDVVAQELALKNEKERQKEKKRMFEKLVLQANGQDYGKKLLGSKNYKADLAQTLQPMPAHTLQAYQYKIEAFTPELRAKHAKDLSLYSGRELA